MSHGNPIQPPSPIDANGPNGPYTGPNHLCFLCVVVVGLSGSVARRVPMRAAISAGKSMAMLQMDIGILMVLMS